MSWIDNWAKQMIQQGHRSICKQPKTVHWTHTTHLWAEMDQPCLCCQRNWVLSYLFPYMGYIHIPGIINYNKWFACLWNETLENIHAYYVICMLYLVIINVIFFLDKIAWVCIYLEKNSCFQFWKIFWSFIIRGKNQNTILPIWSIAKPQL